MIEYLPEPHLMLVSRGEEEASAFMVMSVMSFFHCAMSTKKYLGSLIATTPAGELLQVARVLRANCPMNQRPAWQLLVHLSLLVTLSTLLVSHNMEGATFTDF